MCRRVQPTVRLWKCGRVNNAVASNHPSTCGSSSSGKRRGGPERTRRRHSLGCESDGSLHRNRTHVSPLYVFCLPLHCRRHRYRQPAGTKLAETVRLPCFGSTQLYRHGCGSPAQLQTGTPCGARRKTSTDALVYFCASSVSPSSPATVKRRPCIPHPLAISDITRARHGTSLQGLNCMIGNCSWCGQAASCSPITACGPCGRQQAGQASHGTEHRSSHRCAQSEQRGRSAP